MALYTVWRAVSHTTVRVEDRELVVSYGLLGETRMPLAGIERATVLEKVKPVMRLDGVHLSGLYLGLFKLRDLGRANMPSQDPTKPSS